MTEQVDGVENAEAAVETVADTRNYETEARDMGWVPEADYKGPKEKWKPAQQFVEDGERILPIVRSQLKKTQEQLAKEKDEFAKRLERIEKVSSETLRRAQEQHRQELERIRADQRSAVEAGDVQEFDRLEKVRVSTEKAAPAAEEPKPDPTASLEARRKEWRDANPWFDNDFDAQDWAIRYSDFHGTKNPNLTFEQNMAVVTAEAKKRFPHLFGGEKTNGHAAVDGGGSFGGAPPRKETVNLPPEALAQAKRDVAAKLYPSVEAWAKVYQS